MGAYRRRFLRWLILRFGEDMMIAQNITIDNGSIVVPVHRSHGLIRHITVKNAPIAVIANTTRHDRRR